MSALPFKLEICTPPKGGVSVIRLNDHEWWAGESLEACVAEAGSSWGFSGEELAEMVEDAYEIPDADLDRLHLTADDHGTQQTFREALNRMIADQVRFPAFFAGQE
jgi:hypothetical protein